MTATYIDKHVLLSVFRCYEKDEAKREDYDDASVSQEARAQEELLKLRDRRGSLLGRSVEGDDGGAENAESAANLAEEGQLLLEKD